MVDINRQKSEDFSYIKVSLFNDINPSLLFFVTVIILTCLVLVKFTYYLTSDIVVTLSSLISILT